MRRNTFSNSTSHKGILKSHVMSIFFVEYQQIFLLKSQYIKKRALLLLCIELLIQEIQQGLNGWSVQLLTFSFFLLSV